MTRIIAGTFGGRRIAVPQHKSGRGTRPTTDRVRESLFNLLAARLDFDGIRVLDLYAGSGALGLEALSRGAASVLLVESDAKAAAVIERNIAALGAAGAVVRRAAVATVLTGPATRPADLVVADPPYELSNTEVETVLALLTDNGWTAPGTLAVIERPAGAAELDWPQHWSVGKPRRYGDTRIELAERQ
ncbi:16S rRNA (guanine(966)-N(2))-methyltransferase RsmD [Mycobacterium sp. SMC-4]|uniref:16S rRNA (guanine(966)-N(2))-methyltransferase RsmD n=1 Tax=Mycobacterium sp. SMC-4 TaxID=2857059 RepID=UPI003CFF7ADA